MAKEFAYVNANMLVWGREYTSMTIEYVAQKTGFSEEKLTNWEGGESYPTINQAKKLAYLYKIPFASFFLCEPPEVRKHKHIDYRRKSYEHVFEDEVKIDFEVRKALDRRDMFIELLEGLKEQIPTFNYHISLAHDYMKVAKIIRKILKIDYSIQKTWKKEEAFNYLRRNIEDNGVLVFQSKDLPVNLMRGMAIYEQVLPIIIVNRKDDLKARCFSLIHELVHIMLRTSSVCDFLENSNKIEVYCNKIAGECLVPKELLESEPLIQNNDKINDWYMDDITTLAGNYSVSREVILRRLLDLKYINKGYYEDKQEEYYHQYLESKKKKRGSNKNVQIPVAIDIVSREGKPFIRTVFQAYNSDIISGADVSSILNIKTKHFPRIAEVIYR